VLQAEYARVGRLVTTLCHTGDLYHAAMTRLDASLMCALFAVRLAQQAEEDTR
jgi:hypothetical protein